MKPKHGDKSQVTIIQDMCLGFFLCILFLFPCTYFYLPNDIIENLHDTANVTRSHVEAANTPAKVQILKDPATTTAQELKKTDHLKQKTLTQDRERPHQLYS